MGVPNHGASFRASAGAGLYPADVCATLRAFKGSLAPARDGNILLFGNAYAVGWRRTPIALRRTVESRRN